MKKIISKIMLGTIILEAILVCIFILIGNLGSIDALRALESVGIIFIYSIPCLCYSKIYDNEKYRYMATGGSFFAFVAAILRILNTWELIGTGESVGKINLTLSIIIWMLAFISCIISHISINNTLGIFKKSSVTLITLLSIWATIITWTSMPTGFLLRMFLVLIVLTIASFICTVILIKVYKREIERAEQEAYNASISQSANIVPHNQSPIVTNSIPQNNIEQQNIQQTETIQTQNQNVTPTQISQVTAATNSIPQNNIEQQNIQQTETIQTQNQNVTPTTNSTQVSDSSETFFDSWLNTETVSNNNPQTNNQQ